MSDRRDGLVVVHVQRGPRGGIGWRGGPPGPPTGGPLGGGPLEGGPPGGGRPMPGGGILGGGPAIIPGGGGPIIPASRRGRTHT